MIRWKAAAAPLVSAAEIEAIVGFVAVVVVAALLYNKYGRKRGSREGRK